VATVFANGRSIVHKGDGPTNTSAPPDVCKTPTPGGPVPIRRDLRRNHQKAAKIGLPRWFHGCGRILQM